ncbi:hypothetical protein BD626DRAFT_485538 [Schizophyllum amplum]|uniref:AMP-dependent synthetase/ligase domain-containing protein n=1 Tax=Schizophyllum amplum TaxID=97359 RepID=A0A550CLJ4_9AGAR|nr:hypothetical protein BD626DRAFT_485538 [Auriculariopsis ampla]
MSSTHLSVLESSASRYAIEVIEWQSITYSQFAHDVEHFAKYWTRTLRVSGVPQRSTIGMWIGGFTYIDLLHIYGMCRAGYIPQLFSLRLPNPDVVFELLSRSRARALVYDASFAHAVRKAPIPTHLAIDARGEDLDALPLPTHPRVTADDVAFYYHTSGSTSGSPKVVPYDYRWLESAVNKSEQVSRPRDPARQDVSMWMGSMCHVGQSFMLIGSLQHGSCTIQPRVIGFSSEELLDMISRCGLNRLNQFAGFLAGHLRHAQADPKFHAVLRGFDEILYSGMPLPRAEEQFALQSGLPLVNLLGSTECGAMMRGDDGILRPLRGTRYEFVPIDGAVDTGYESSARLLEMVIRGDSPDCPRDRRAADGHFHTGDLFAQVVPGGYVYRGRDDDWIKSQTSLRCDTRAIEDNARATCGHLIAECIVVGTGRPSPVIFIEPVDANADAEKIKREIIRKTRAFHSRRYLHERITSTKMVIVVPRGTLPRTATKGNVRRQAIFA